MAWAYMQTTETLKWEDYERVAEALGDEAPDGLIVHVAGRDGDRVRMIDVWESQEAFERFRSERLGPTVARVVGEEAMAQGQPTREEIKVEHILRP